MGRITVEKRVPVFMLLKCLLCSYILTAIMLLVLAGALYKLGLSEKIVAVGIILIYVMSTFVGGFIVGKRMQSRKFLWGLLMGAAYFCVLALVSLLINQSVSELGDSFMSTLMICSAGGMLGGMLG